MKNIIYVCLLLIMAVAACSGTTKESKKDEQKITIKRFDKDVYSYLQQPDSSTEQFLINEYPTLLPAFGRIAMDDSDPTTIFPSMRNYFSNDVLLKIYKDALLEFNDVSAYEDELNVANNLVSQYFAGQSLPELAMHVSGFRENVIILNNLISISIDKYLGSNYSEYSEFFRPYERQQMQSKYVVRDYLKAWLMSDIVLNRDKDQSLIDAMIEEGKILYALSNILPEYSSEDIIGYTPQQLQWCTDNEKLIWKKIVKQNYLFSKDNMLITRFINEAPNTILVSPEAPGRVGSWIGWQIVKKYASKKNIPVSELINIDAQTILKEAKFNP